MADKEYTSLVKDILANGIPRKDRTGTGTLSVFGRTMRFDLGTSFPLVTTKKVFFKGVAEELFWMIHGCTDAKALDAKGVKIWNDNGSREFLDSCGLPYPEGELGPVYGHQWRHFGAQYRGSHADYTNQGVDQLSEIIHLIKTDPTSRRMLLVAWNPAQNKEMALPACHCLAQFYVDTTKQTLSCHLYQRSGDVGLGVPFNIASYALLTCIISKMCSLEPGELVHTIGDAHIYLNHVDSLREQITRTHNEPPVLKVKCVHDSIDKYCIDDIELTGYVSHKTIPMKMAV